MKVFDATPGATKTSELRDIPSPWFIRPGILIAAAALIAGVGIVLSGPREPGSPTDMNTPRSTSFSLIATDIWAPPPPPPPAAPAAPAPPQVAYNPAPIREAVPAPPPPPPPPPPPVLVLRLDNPVTAAFVSMTNHADQPAVGCTMTTVAIAGTAAAINYRAPDNQFTVVGSEEARIPAGGSLGPATGSTWHLTVTCDNGLSTSLDQVY